MGRPGGPRARGRWTGRAGVGDAEGRVPAEGGQLRVGERLGGQDVVGRAAYATGFTGLGVGASRFAADVMLDLVEGRPTERTRLTMIRSKPLPFPPEPVAWIGIQATRWSLAREDVTGRRNLWLRILDRLGLGFDS